MAGYDPQRNRARRTKPSLDEPAPVDALLGPTSDAIDRAPDPVPVAVNDEVGPAPEPMVDLRAVPDPQPAADPEPVTESVVEPEPAVEPEPDAEPESENTEPFPASAPTAATRSSPVGKVVAAIIAVLAVLAFLIARARRRR